MNEPLSYPVPRLAKLIQSEWAAELSAHLRCSESEFVANPEGRMSYPIETLRVELMDGSNVEFKYAFALVSEERRAIAVFSEHCGHHIFPYHEAKVYRNGMLQFEQVV